ARAGLRIGNHELTVVGQRERHRFEQVVEPDRFAIAGDPFWLEVVFVELRLDVVESDLLCMSCLVLRLETVWVYVRVPDHVTRLVDTKLSSTFIPVTPGVDRAVRLNLGVDEEILHPFVAGTGERIAKP